MTITPYEAEQEAAFDAFVDDIMRENQDTIIENFTMDRLKSYYLKDSYLLKPASIAIEDAKKYIKLNKTASFIFSSIAIEVSLRSGIIKPIVYGLVHTEKVASLITDLVLSQKNLDRLKLLMFDILKHNGGINLKTYTRQNSQKTLWEEMKLTQKKRNLVIHRGERVDQTEVEFAFGIASELFDNIIPKVLNSINLLIKFNHEISSK